MFGMTVQRRTQPPIPVPTDAPRSRLPSTTATGTEAITVVVPSTGPDTGGIWELDAALVIPSNTTLLLDGCTIRLDTGTNDNLIRNANPFDGGNTEIRIIGRNGAHLDGNAGGQSHAVWGYRNNESYRYFGIYLCRVEGFEISNLKIGPTAAWAIAPQASGNGLLSEIEFAQDGATTNQDGITSGRGLFNTTIRNLTGATHDDTIDIASTDQSKFCPATQYNRYDPDTGAPIGTIIESGANDVVTDCYNVLVENVTTSHTNGTKCVKLVAGNGRTVRDILIRDITSLSDGYAIEIEGDWATVRPTVDEMKDITIDGVRTGNSRGVLTITSNCRNVSLTNTESTQGYGRIVLQAAGTRAIDLEISNVMTTGDHRTNNAGELFYFLGQGNESISIRNVMTEGRIRNLFRSTGSSITGLVIEDISLFGLSDVMLLGDSASDVRGIASGIFIRDPEIPNGILKQDLPNVTLTGVTTGAPLPPAPGMRAITVNTSGNLALLDTLTVREPGKHIDTVYNSGEFISSAVTAFTGNNGGLLVPDGGTVPPVGQRSALLGGDLAINTGLANVASTAGSLAVSFPTPLVNHAGYEAVLFELQGNDDFTLLKKDGSSFPVSAAAFKQTPGQWAVDLYGPANTLSNLQNNNPIPAQNLNIEPRVMGVYLIDLSDLGYAPGESTTTLSLASAPGSGLDPTLIAGLPEKASGYAAFVRSIPDPSKRGPMTMRMGTAGQTSWNTPSDPAPPFPKVPALRLRSPSIPRTPSPSFSRDPYRKRTSSTLPNSARIW